MLSNNQLIIKIENDGAPLTNRHHILLKEGVGLSNINDRLANLYGKNYYFKIQNKKNEEGVETIIKIPLE